MAKNGFLLKVQGINGEKPIKIKMRNATKKCILVNEIKKLKSNYGTFLKTKKKL
jgi:hypothetical protein